MTTSFSLHPETFPSVPKLGDPWGSKAGRGMSLGTPGPGQGDHLLGPWQLWCHPPQHPSIPLANCWADEDCPEGEMGTHSHGNLGPVSQCLHWGGGLGSWAGTLGGMLLQA